jgi:hypothetical protein
MEAIDADEQDVLDRPVIPVVAGKRRRRQEL